MRLAPTSALALGLLLGGPARAQEAEAPAMSVPEPPRPPVIAPWTPVEAWHLSPSDAHEAPFRLRVGFGVGPSTNLLHLSETEQRLFSLSRSGVALSEILPDWPHDTLAGMWIEPSVGLAWYGKVLGGATAVSFQWDGRVAIRAPDVSDQPMRLALRRTLREGQESEHPLLAGRGSLWLSLALVANPHHYERPLPVPDPALEDPLPDRYVPGVRRLIGGELTGAWVPVAGLALSPYGTLQRGTYPEGLASWDVTVWDAGARARWLPTRAVFAEVRGGYASEVARGDLQTTDKREPDPSWSGTRWGLEVGADTSGLQKEPFRVLASADLVQKNYRTSDLTDLAHSGRRDVGGSATALGAWALPFEWSPTEVALTVSYTYTWNHTNLPAVIRPPDEGDFMDHTAMVRVQVGHDTALSRKPDGE